MVRVKTEHLLTPSGDHPYKYSYFSYPYTSGIPPRIPRTGKPTEPREILPRSATSVPASIANNDKSRRVEFIYSGT